MSSVDEVVMVSDAVATVTTDSEVWEVVPDKCLATISSSSDKDDSQADIPNDVKDVPGDSAASSVDTSTIPITSVATKVEPKQEPDRYGRGRVSGDSR